MTKSTGLDDALFTSKKVKPVYLEETLTIRDEAELRILAGCYANPGAFSLDQTACLMEAKTMADLWMKART